MTRTLILLCFFSYLLQFLAADNVIVLGKYGPTSKVNLSEVDKEVKQIKDIFKPESFNKATIQALKDQEEFFKKFKVTNEQKKAEITSFHTKLKLHVGPPERFKLNNTRINQHYKKGTTIYFFATTPHDVAFKCTKFAKKIYGRYAGYCVKWDNKEQLERFAYETNRKFTFQALTNDKLVEVFGISKYPAIIQVIDEKTIGVQYGL